jgi:hypothetical protein
MTPTNRKPSKARRTRKKPHSAVIADLELYRDHLLAQRGLAGDVASMIRFLARHRPEVYRQAAIEMGYLAE